MSDTPLTDALWERESFRMEAINADRCGGSLVSILRDHARSLERALAARERELGEAVELLEECRGELAWRTSRP